MRHTPISCLLFLLAACGNDPGDTAYATAGSEVHGNAEPTGTLSTPAFPLASCYQMVFKRDTANLHLEVRDTTVSGTLEFRLFEKDRNTGTLQGVVRDNHIRADYTFQSEGTTSVREVVFRIEDTALLQAHGDIEDRNGKFVFTDPERLDYQREYPFLRVPCDPHQP